MRTPGICAWTVCAGVWAGLVLGVWSGRGASAGEAPQTETRPAEDEQTSAEEEAQTGERESVKGVVELGEIVVTATRTLREVGDVPAHVTVVTGDEIRRKNVQSADEALRHAVGVYGRRGKGLMDTLSEVSLRGFPKSSRTLVLVDGQMLNEARTGSTHWSAIPVEDIDRIEVVRGPYSALYGGSAMGGVVNVVTRMPDELELDFKGSYGTHRTQTYHVGCGNRVFDKLRFRFGYDRKKTHGYVSDYVYKTPSSAGAGTPVTGWDALTEDSRGRMMYRVGHKGRNWAEEDSFNAKLSLELSPDWEVSVGVIHSEYDYGYDVGEARSYLKDANGNAIESGYVTFHDPASGDVRLRVYPANFLGGPGGQENEIYTVELKGNVTDEVDVKATWGMTDQRENWYVTPSYRDATRTGGAGTIAHNPSQLWQLDLQTSIAMWDDRNTVTFGVNYKEGQTDTEVRDLDNWRDRHSKGARTRRTRGSQRTEALYIQDEWRIVPDKLTLTAGARYEHWECYDGYAFQAGALSENYQDRTTDQWCPKIGLLCKPWEDSELPVLEGTSFRASAGRAFRPPNLYELYSTWAYYSTVYAGNPDLKAETADSWEVGVDQELWGDRTLIRVTYFESYIDDLIYSAEVIPGRKQKLNAGKGEIKGVEAEVSQQVTSWLDAFANLTVQHTEITRNPANRASEGRRFTYVPAYMANAGLALHRGPVEASLTWNYLDKRYNRDDNSDEDEGVFTSRDSRSLIDLKVTGTIHKNLKVFCGVDNIFDETYYDYYKCAGRTYYGGLELGF